MRLVIRFESRTACWPGGEALVLHLMSRRNLSDRTLDPR